MVPVYSIFRKTQKELHSYILKRMMEFYPTSITATKKYIMAQGDIPIMLVAHLDTVFPEPTRHDMQIFYDQSHKVMWSPEGLGADDRAGVILILKILEAGYRPHILFTHDEEIGGLGAIDVTIDFPKPEWDMRYIIQLDRMGYNDCVFYSCDNQEFISYVESFDFAYSFGSFSDISILMPAWKVAGVNVSVGYLDEHFESEYWHVDWANETYYRIIAMLSAPPESQFVYIPRPVTLLPINGGKQSTWTKSFM